MKRIQRKRTNGWKMPNNTIYVGRPTKYGNPFKLIGDILYVDASHRRKILSPWIIYDHNYLYTKEEGIKKCVELYKSWVIGNITSLVKPCPFTLAKARKELIGNDLACFCSLSSPCHADILIELLTNPL